MRKTDLLIIVTVFASITLSVLFPKTFIVFSDYVIYLLMFFVFLSFIGVKVEDGLKLFSSNLTKFVFLIFLKLLLYPALVFIVFKLFLPEYSNAVLLLAGVSTGVVAPFIGSVVGAEITTILVMVVITTLLIPFTLPFLIKLLTETDVSLSFLEMIKTLSLIVFVPVSIAILIKKFHQKVTEVLLTKRFPLSLVSLALINLGVFSKYSNFFHQRPSLIIQCILASLLLGSLNLIAGYFAPIFSRKEFKLASAISFVNVNNVLIIVFSSKFFGFLEPTLAAMYMFPFFLVILPLRYLQNLPSTSSNR